MDRVQETHEEIVITKHGRPVARLVHVEKKGEEPLFGFLKGRIMEKGDIVNSPRLQWNADK